MNLVVARAFLEKTEIAHLLHLRVALEEFGDLTRAGEGRLHAQLHRLQRACEHPARVRIEIGAHARAQLAHRRQHRRRPHGRAADQVGMPADILGERVDRDVRAVRERGLTDRTEDRIVHHHDRTPALLGLQLVGERLHQLKIDQLVRRIGRRLGVDHRDRALLAGLRDLLADFFLPRAGEEIVAGDPVLRKNGADQGLGAAVERGGLQDHVAGMAVTHDHRGDRAHAGGEDQRVFGAVEQGETVFEHFHVGVVEARVEQARLRRVARLGASAHHAEEGRALFGCGEREGRGLENRRLDRALGELGVEAVAHH